MHNKQQLIDDARRSILEFEAEGSGGSDVYIPPPNMSLNSLIMDNLGIPQQTEGITMGGISTPSDPVETDAEVKPSSSRKKASTKKGTKNNQPSSLDNNNILYLIDEHITRLHRRLDDIEFSIKTSHENTEEQDQQNNSEVYTPAETDPIPVEFRLGFGIKYEFQALTRYDYDDFIVLTLPRDTFKLAIDSNSKPQDTYLAFDNGQTVIPGFLLGKPFCIDPNNPNSVDLLIFLQTNEEGE